MMVSIIKVINIDFTNKKKRLYNTFIFERNVIMNNLEIALEALDSTIDRIDIAEEGVGTFLALATLVPIGLGLSAALWHGHNVKKIEEAINKNISKSDQAKILNKSKELVLEAFKKARNDEFRRKFKKDITIKDLSAEFIYYETTKQKLTIRVYFDDRYTAIDGDDEETENSIYRYQKTVKYDYVNQQFVD